MTNVPYSYKRLHGHRYAANSNNGDIGMVLATVIGILKDFTAEFPQAEIYFSGSTPERTRLYARILKTYFAFFSKEYKITAIVGSDNDNQQVLFDPDSRIEYLGFLVKRN
jgi:hypothetical protein